MHSALVITFLALAGVAFSSPRINEDVMFDDSRPYFMQEDDAKENRVDPIRTYGYGSVQNTPKFRHIYSLDMSISSETCPSVLKLFENEGLRTCGKGTNGAGCDSFTISTGGQGYTQVAGKIVGYQFGSPDAFGAGINNINSYYVDGISITHGQNPNRKHIWTYAIAVRQNVFPGASDNGNTCPSTGVGDAPPSFVGKDYFCSSASTTKNWQPIFYTTPLWSNILGDCATERSCGANLVYFCVTLPEQTTDDLEIRVCTNNVRSNEDIRIGSMDFWVQ